MDFVWRKDNASDGLDLSHFRPHAEFSRMTGARFCGTYNLKLGSVGLEEYRPLGQFHLNQVASVGNVIALKTHGHLPSRFRRHIGRHDSFTNGRLRMAWMIDEPSNPRMVSQAGVNHPLPRHLVLTQREVVVSERPEFECKRKTFCAGV